MGSEGNVLNGYQATVGFVSVTQRLQQLADVSLNRLDVDKASIHHSAANVPGAERVVFTIA